MARGMNPVLATYVLAAVDLSGERLLGQTINGRKWTISELYLIGPTPTSTVSIEVRQQWAGDKSLWGYAASRCGVAIPIARARTDPPLLVE